MLCISALSILNVNNDKLEIALISEFPSYAHSPQISKDGKHVAYYIIDGESVLDPDEKRIFVVLAEGMIYFQFDKSSLHSSFLN